MHPRGWTPLISVSLIAAISFAIPARVDGQNTTELTKLAPELEAIASSSSADNGESVPVIVQTRASEDRLTETLESSGARLKRALPLVGGYVADVSRSTLALLARDEATVYVSLDRETWLLSDRYDYNLIRRTTGAENVIGSTGLAVGTTDGTALADYVRSLPAGPNGTGVTIAVLDSGVFDSDSLHEDLRSVSDAASSRVLAHGNFVSTESMNGPAAEQGFDPYGHGTHVAGVAAGSGRESLDSRVEVGNFYAGIAFNANLVDLRVIGADGRGRISDTIAAIDWMVRNRVEYRIRVANLSIGAAVTQSYRTDPLCQAVERAVHAGIVCVVAAGNFGKDSAGNPVYGSILSPANDPWVITVGATNTWGSAARSDDTIASYSSRGPSLIDNVAKPDLVAPGTLIRSIASPGNYLTTANHLTVYSRDGQDVYMWLSGTSLAAPVVSGTVALMLDANPGLTPSMVKSILQFTAQPLVLPSITNPLLSLLTQGAGYVNAEAAVRLAATFRRDAGYVWPGSFLLTADSSQINRFLYRSSDGSIHDLTSDIEGERITWGTNILYSEGIAYIHSKEGALLVFNTAGWQITSTFNLISGYLALKGPLVTGGVVFDQGRLITGGVVFDQGQLTTGGVVFDQSRVLSSNAWLLASDTNVLTNPSAAQSLWSTNLMDQSAMASGVVFDQHAATERVMAFGENASGNDITRIDSQSHPLFPRRKKIRR